MNEKELTEIFNFLATDKKDVAIIKCKAYTKEEFINLFIKEEDRI